MHRPRHERQAETELQDYDAECCSECGVHPSTWSAKYGGDVRKPAVVPEWQYCRVCHLIALAQKAGPPDGKDAPGWHIALVPTTYDY